MLNPGHPLQPFTVWRLPAPPAETVHYADGQAARLVRAEVSTIQPSDRNRYSRTPELRQAWLRDIQAGGGFDLVAVKPNRRLPTVVLACWPHSPCGTKLVPITRLASTPNLPPWGVLQDGVVYRWHTLALGRRLTPADFCHLASLCRCGGWFHWPVGSVHHIYFEDERDLVAGRLLLSD